VAVGFIVRTPVRLAWVSQVTGMGNAERPHRMCMPEVP
jgi:hypothetical protein